MSAPRERLAFFTASMIGGGAERVLLNLAQGVAGEGYDVDLVLARVEGPYVDAIPGSLRLVDLGAPRVLASVPALVRYLRRERPRAMLSAMNYVNVVAIWAWRLARVPTRLVVSAHSVMSQAVGSSSNPLLRMVPLLSRSYGWAGGVVAVSESVREDLARMTGLPIERIRVIYNPVVTPELKRKADAPLGHPWFEPGSPPVLVAVGSMKKAKDFPTLIRAFARVRRKRAARLIILGDGRERPALEGLVDQLGLGGDVSLPGFVENPYPYVARASLFVLSSLYEALPTVLIEALYCGAPIVATDSPGGTREILRDGRYGRLVPVGNAAALAEAIGLALDDPPPSPPRESWLPFQMDAAVGRYLDVLLGG